jgi:hypothetical protein
MGGAFPGKLHRASVGAVDDEKKMESFPEFGAGQAGKKFRFLDQVGSPEKPVASPPGTFNAEASSSQPLDLLPNGGAGRPQPISDLLAGNEFPRVLLKYYPKQFPHPSPVQPNRSLSRQLDIDQSDLDRDDQKQNRVEIHAHDLASFHIHCDRTFPALGPLGFDLDSIAVMLT